MSTLQLAFERNGAHALALLGTGIAAVLLVGTGDLLLAGVVLAGTMWLYVLGYLAVVYERFRAERRGRSWSRYEQLLALGELVRSDSRVGTAPLPVVLGGLAGTVATMALAFTVVDPLELPTWALLLYPVPAFPLLLPLGLGSMAHRTRRLDPDVDVDVGTE